MSLTPTNPIDLGFKAPEFILPDVTDGNLKSYAELRGENGTVVMFICNHCPFVIHVMESIVKLASDHAANDIGFIAISSNDVKAYPADSPEQMKLTAEKYSFSFPYLYDESQEVAKAYDAACTPDFSVFDQNDICVYRGQLDDSRPGNGIISTGESIQEVLELLLQRKQVPTKGQKPSIGCNIKWK